MNALTRCEMCGYPAYLGECGCDPNVLWYLHGTLRAAYLRTSPELRRKLSTLDIAEVLEVLKMRAETEERAHHYRNFEQAIEGKRMEVMTIKL